jgi:hypothetical protein
MLAVVLIAGCDDSPSDPNVQPIVGTWKASKIGQVFTGASDLTVEFTSSGSLSIAMGSESWSGSYRTSGTSSSSSIRHIDITVSDPVSRSFSGIYTVSGSQLKLELVPSPAPNGVTAPDAALGIGSTTVNGSSTNDYVTELQKQ